MTPAERVTRSWQTRRAVYGPSGGNVGGDEWKSARPGRELVHGSRNTYYRRGCRCESCTSAARANHDRLEHSNDRFMLGRLLPDDFDDDSRIFAAMLRYHTPQAWADAL